MRSVRQASVTCPLSSPSIIGVAPNNYNILRRTLNSAYYSINGSCSLREKNRMRAVLAGIPLALVPSWMERRHTIRTI